MRTSRRVMLSLFCVALAVLLIFLRSLFGFVGTRAQQLHELKGAAEILPVYFLFALPGWLIALPFVILFKDAEGWRGWATLLIGTAIGPAFMLIGSLLASPGRLTWQSEGFGIVASLIISLVTTISYVTTLKVAHRRSALTDQ